MTLHRIRLEMARDREFPDGNHRRGYEFVAPLDADGHLVARGFAKLAERCVVTRFWDGERTELGHLARRKRGDWVFDYDGGDDDDDEAGYRFGSHSFKVGDYVSVTEHDGVTRTFRVVAAALQD